jgi:hypothetical protein
MSENLNKLYMALDKQKDRTIKHFIILISIMILFLFLRLDIFFFIIFGWFLIRITLDITTILYLCSMIEKFEFFYELFSEEIILKMIEMEDE